MSAHNSFDSLQTFDLGNGNEGQFYSLPALEAAGLGKISRLPACLRIVLGKKFEARKKLEKAIDIGGDTVKMRALDDSDFEGLWRSGEKK